MEEDLTVRARIDDELSGPIREIRQELGGLGDESVNMGRKADTGSRGLRALGTAGRWAARGALAAAAGIGAAGFAAYKLGRSAIEQASTLGESVNAITVTYGKNAKAVLGLSRAAAKAVGLSRSQFNSLAVRFSSFAETVSGGGKKTVGVLDDLTTRAADFASVMNIDVNEAAELFQSGLAGETEPLRKYGMDLSAAKVEAYAYAKGIAKVGEDLTEQQKIQARYGTLMEQTNKSAGDFRNTSDSLANSSRILAARWDNAQAKLGKALLPYMQTFVRYLLREGLPAFDRFSTWFTDKGLPAITRFIDKAKPKLARFLEVVTPIAKDVGPALADAFERVAGWAEKAAPHVHDLVKGFRDMPSWAKSALIGGGLAAYAGSKIARSPAGGLVAKAVGGVQKVWVMNPGFGGKPGTTTGPGGVPIPTDGPDGKPKPAAAPRGGILGKLGRGAKYLAPLAMTVPLPALGSEVRMPTPVTDPKVLADAQAKINAFYTRAAAGARIFTDALDGNAGGVDHLNRKFRAMMLEAGVADTKVIGLGKNLTDVASQRPTPKITVTGIPESRRAVDDFIRGPLKAVETPRTAHVKADTSGAVAQVNYLDRMIAGLSRTVTVDLTPRGFGAAPREHGGPVKAGRPYIVGEKRPELFVPETNGKIIPRVDSPVGQRGGLATATAPIVIGPGAIVVNNPASGVELEEAIAAGIERAARDARERGKANPWLDD